VINSVAEQILEMGSRFAARPAKPSSRIYADLGINGSDIIEFVEAIEKRYGVDLQWISPRNPLGQFYDASLVEIAEFIASGIRLP